ncbi:MAG: O-antigen ligase family protein [Planctomycetota bacterium]
MQTPENTSASRSLTVLHWVVAAAILVFVGRWAFEVLDAWIDAGVFPRAFSWTSRWPLAIVAVGAVSVGATLVRRRGPLVLAAAFTTASLLASIVPSLPPESTNVELYDGPFLAPFYVFATLAAVLYVAAGPRSHPDHQRIALVLLFVCTANTKLYERADAAATSFLILLLAVVALLATPVPTRLVRALREDRGAQALAAVLATFVGWILLSVVTGDSRLVGFASAVSVVSGAVLFCVVTCAFDRAGVRRALATFVLGGALCCTMAIVGMAETAQYETWERVLSTRLRLFQSHANIVAPYFAGLALCCFVLLPLRDGGAGRVVLRRLVLAAVGGTSLWLLLLTASRASQFGFAVGLGAAVTCFFVPLPRRPFRWYAAGGALLAVLVALWFTPVADGARGWLEAKSFEPSSAIGQRYHYWRMSSDAIADHPLLGVGPEQNYMHARYALPSYYDGTRQNFHPHNILFYFAEGSGLPALALFLLGLLGLVEMLRRTRLRIETDQRALVVAVAVVPAAMLAANMLDLGQVQPTYVPLWFWWALGLAGALLRSTGPTESAHADAVAPDASATDPPARRLGAVGVVLGAGVAIVFGLRPLDADVHVQRGYLVFDVARRTTRDRDQAELRRGLEEFATARAAVPPHPSSGTWDGRLLRFVDMEPGEQETLEKTFHEWMVRAEPGRSTAWLGLAWCLLELGEFEEAETAVETSRALDPRGPTLGSIALARCWAQLADGRTAEAEESLVDALRNATDELARVPHVDVAIPGGAGEKRRYQVTDASGAVRSVELDAALDRLGREMLDLAVQEPVRARRYLASLERAFRAQKRPEDALPWFQGYRKIVGEPIFSVIKLEYDLLRDTGRDVEAAALVRSLPEEARAVFDHDRQTPRTTSDNPTLLEGLVRSELDALRGRDIFFDANEHSATFESAMRTYARLGKWDEALTSLERRRRESPSPRERSGSSMRAVTEDFAARGAPPEVLLEAVGRTIRSYDLALRGGDTATLDNLAKRLRTSWRGREDELVGRARSRFGGVCRAGEALIERLEKRR